MSNIFGIGSAQLSTDSAVKLLQCIVQAADRLLTGVLVSAGIQPLLSFKADRICVVHHPSGCNLDAPVADQTQLLREHAKLL